MFSLENICSAVNSTVDPVRPLMQAISGHCLVRFRRAKRHPDARRTRQRKAMLWVDEIEDSIKTSPMTFLHSSVNTQLRSAMKEMLREFTASHVFTLAFHEHISLDRATKKLSKWYSNVMQRLFRRHCFQLPVSQTIEFWLLPERGNANLHFHGLIRVPNDRLAYFESYALPHWRDIAQKGTHDFRPIKPDEYERNLGYITKGTHATDIEISVLHSSMLHHFDIKRMPLISVGCRQPDYRQTKADNTEALR